jgi:K+ transporter
MGQASSQAAGDVTQRQTDRHAGAAVGVVYGDIGTSPLYTLKEVLPAVMAYRSTTMESSAFWR